MCGIAAILPAGDLDLLPGAIEDMTAALRHRGPDENACVHLPGYHLGHTRLSIIDPAGGHQPMPDPTGRYHVVFNGEIYNHRELRADLERRGHVFRTRCDTEVLLAGFGAYGPSVVSKLNGQFAFLIWDAQRRTAFLARDRFGEKPLYRARTPAGHWLIASEIKAILASGLVTPRIDRVSVDAYLGLLYVPPDRCIYENVHPLPPARAASWSDGAWTEWKYWEPRFGGNDVPEEQAVPHVMALVEQAVRRQTVADVPVGAFLSGGLDSSTIVALMSRRASQPVRTFAAGFGDTINELPFARDVAGACGTEHREIQIDVDVGAMLHRMTDVYDEPFADSSNIPTYLISEAARRDVKVVLSGDGGDEIFGGYDWYTPLLQYHPAAGGASASPDCWERHLASSTGLTADRRHLWRDGRQPAAAEVVKAAYVPPPHLAGMDGAVSFDAGCYLPGDILVKVDRAAMAHGLETRCPFLDVDLAEFVLGLPWRTRFGGALKHLLRRACEDLWPPSVRSRGKQGFGAPVRRWLERAEVQELWQRVTRADAPLVALLPGVPVASETLRPQQKWTLLCLGLWLEKHPQCLANLS